MSTLPSDYLALGLRPDQGINLLESELLAEKASSLGHHGRRVEVAMARLREHDAAGGSAEARLALVKQAARDVWAYFVQRELCGFRDHRDIIRQNSIPQEVLARLGAIEK